LHCSGCINDISHFGRRAAKYVQDDEGKGTMGRPRARKRRPISKERDRANRWYIEGRRQRQATQAIALPPGATRGAANLKGRDPPSSSIVKGIARSRAAPQLLELT
jgi:hypothetical protein